MGKNQKNTVSKKKLKKQRLDNIDSNKTESNDIVVDDNDSNPTNIFNWDVIDSSIDIYSKIIVFNNEESLPCYLSGVAHLTLLKGSINLNGYTLQVGKTIKFHSPIWQPAMKMLCSNKQRKNQHSLQYLLKKAELNDSFPTIPSLYNEKDVGILLIQGLNEHSMEWLEAAEDYSLYNHSLINVNKNNTISFYSGFITYNISLLHTLDISYLNYPQSWIESVNQILINRQNEMNNNYENNNDINNKIYLNNITKLLICGAKGVGKSTCLRYTINKLLNKSKLICLIDCDIGQPELTVNGLLSLHIIRSPILVPIHMNLQIEPELSFYFGDITTKNNPELLLNAIKLLYKKYLELQIYYFKNGFDNENENNNENNNTNANEKKKMTKNTENFETNIFSLLNSNNTSSYSLPLIVNCDGFIRFIGLEILSSIIEIIQPNSIFHIITAKDPILIPLENPNKTFQKYLLEPGQLKPSKIHAIDLRNLRIISYFLRNEIKLKEKINKINIKCSININNGFINDYIGHLSHSLMNNDYYEINFHSIAFRLVNNESIVPRLTLASFNGSLVGISSYIDNSNSNSNTQTINISSDIRTDTNQSTEEITLMASETKKSFQLNCIGISPLTPCKGIGIISAIDVTNEQIQLITPIKNIPNNKIYLLKGNLQLPLNMIHSLAMTSYSYLTGEGFGEGNHIMKPRTNLKRKSHYNPNNSNI